MLMFLLLSLSSPFAQYFSESFIYFVGTMINVDNYETTTYALRGTFEILFSFVRLLHFKATNSYLIFVFVIVYLLRIIITKKIK